MSAAMKSAVSVMPQMTNWIKQFVVTGPILSWKYRLVFLGPARPWKDGI